MNKLKWMPGFAFSALALTSCVTNSSGSQETAIAAVVVFSHLVNSAQNGDTSAKKAWCRAFDLVQAQVQGSPGTDPALDSEVKEKLIPEMHNIMRANGYQLHRQQIGMVIQDALNVSRNEKAKEETVTNCASLTAPAASDS